MPCKLPDRAIGALCAPLHNNASATSTAITRVAAEIQQAGLAEPTTLNKFASRFAVRGRSAVSYGMTRTTLNRLMHRRDANKWRAQIRIRQSLVYQPSKTRFNCRRGMPDHHAFHIDKHRAIIGASNTGQLPFPHWAIVPFCAFKPLHSMS